MTTVSLTHARSGVIFIDMSPKNRIKQEIDLNNLFDDFLERYFIRVDSLDKDQELRQKFKDLCKEIFGASVFVRRRKNYDFFSWVKNQIFRFPKK